MLLLGFPFGLDGFDLVDRSGFQAFNSTELHFKTPANFASTTATPESSY